MECGVGKVCKGMIIEIESGTMYDLWRIAVSTVAI